LMRLCGDTHSELTAVADGVEFLAARPEPEAQLRHVR
jgi:hypothetical protein